MGRLVIAVLLMSLAAPAQLREREESSESTAPLVEEDEDLVIRTEYVFNPIQAAKDLKVGDFYANKGNHRAAAGRYLEATKWNPSFSEAYWKLGRSREKLDQPDQALEAYQKYLELEPNGKQSREARKRVAELEALREKLPLAQKGSAAKEGEKPEEGQKPRP
jgi:tetratricopeptide (TPR) repeat protein